MRRALLALALSGCSLAVDGLSPPTCSTNSECAILNEMNGIAADACELYQCSQDAICELGVRDGDRDGRVALECAGAAPQMPIDCNDAVAGGSEVCNGVDDDCDGVIDERFVVDAVAANPLPAAAPTALITGSFSENGFVGYGASPGALALAHAEAGVGRFGLVSGAMSSGPVNMSFARAADLADLNDGALVRGCHVPASGGGFTTHDCRFHDLDLGLTAEAVFTTVVSRSGCSPGQVRVGYFPRGDASTPAVIERGPLRRSNAFFGVDLAADGLTCTGASRSSGVLGAARPSVAAMDLAGAEDQALAAWLADGFDRPACGGDEVDVEALGLHVQETTFGATYGWVTASDEGAPRVLGRTTQGGRPAIGVWENVGYVVGFGASGGVQLVFVEMMARPPAFTPGAADDRSGLETGALAIDDLGTIEADAVNDVAIALGSIRDGGIELGVAWREGCGSEAQTVRFRQLFVKRDGEGVSIDEARSFETIALTPSSTAEAGPPDIVYAFGGMLAPGVERADGRPTGSEQTDGGYFVAWSDGSSADGRRILARRVSEADGALLNAEELLVLSAPGDGQDLHPVLYRDTDEGVRHAFFRPGEAGGFYGGPLTCQPPR